MNDFIIDFATRYRLEHHLFDLPIKFKTLCELLSSEGYELISYDEIRNSGKPEIFEFSEYADKKAYTIKHAEYKVVCYNNQLPYDERNFALAHELGHIYLEHTSNGILGKSADPNVENKQEIEADDMALYLLSPPCLLAFATSDDFLSDEKVQKITALPPHYAAKVRGIANALKVGGRKELSADEEKLLKICCTEKNLTPYEPPPNILTSVPDTSRRDSKPGRSGKSTFWEDHWYLLTGGGALLIIICLIYGISNHIF